MQKKRRLKNSKINSFRDLYINENLSPVNRKPYNYLYKLKKTKKIHDVWTHHGHVNFIFTNDEAEDAKEVYHVSDIEHYIGERNIVV